MPHERQLLQTLRIIHLALCLSTLIYGVVAFVVTSSQPTPVPAPNPILLYVLSFVGGSILLVVAPSMKRILGGPKPDQVRVASIVTWALCEAVAILGLVAALVFDEPLYFVPFGVAGLGGLVFFAPRADALGQ